MSPRVRQDRTVLPGVKIIPSPFPTYWILTRVKGKIFYFIQQHPTCSEESQWPPTANFNYKQCFKMPFFGT